jgi:hypothetical protein
MEEAERAVQTAIAHPKQRSNWQLGQRGWRAQKWAQAARDDLEG